MFVNSFSVYLMHFVEHRLNSTTFSSVIRPSTRPCTRHFPFLACDVQKSRTSSIRLLHCPPCPPAHVRARHIVLSTVSGVKCSSGTNTAVFASCLSLAEVAESSSFLLQPIALGTFGRVVIAPARVPGLPCCI